MKIIKFIAVLPAAAMLLTGCGSTAPSDTNISDYYATMAVDDTSADAPAATPDTSSGDIDIDLTKLDSNMVYAQVYDMVNNGDDYLGKTVKAKGPFSYFQETDGREFFAVLISDATACCSQGIEFVLDGDHSYPADYPAIGTDITVVGKFNYYKEDYYTYCQLLDADMEVDQSLSW
ncbi:MAG TPA: hypothetical protein P5191_06540 [Ruminococcus sp.]|nr:hypothetical protein [Ruminococcus sp.]